MQDWSCPFVRARDRHEYIGTLQQYGVGLVEARSAELLLYSNACNCVQACENDPMMVAISWKQICDSVFEAYSQHMSMVLAYLDSPHRNSNIPLTDVVKWTMQEFMEQTGVNALREQVQQEQYRIRAMLDEAQRRTYESTIYKCKHCGSNNVQRYMAKQMRAGDESETIYYECLICATKFRVQ